MSNSGSISESSSGSIKRQTVGLPSLESRIHQPQSWFVPLSWEDVFGHSSKRIHIDVGAGDGGFIRARAKKHPDTNFIAIERLLGRVRKINRGTLRDGLNNLRVLRIEAAYAFGFLFPAESIDSITVLFPDPWPKRRHHPNRIIQKAFLDQCARCLKPNGWIAMKTDDAIYFSHMMKMVEACDHLKLWEVEASDLIPELTDFEKEFLMKQKQINFLAARRVS
jgi:tRNA (guanine-N7-)-methyltransferase